MAISASVLSADIAGVETDEADIGTVVTVTLPNGSSTVTALRRGQSNEFGVEIAGFTDKRRDEVSIRASLLTAAGFNAAAVRAWAKTSAFTIDSQSWAVDSVDSPDSAVYFFKLVQNW